MAVSGSAQREAGLRRIRSVNTGMVIVSAAAVGVISATVAAATPGHASGVSQNSPASTQDPAGQLAQQDQSQGDQSQQDQSQQNSAPQQAQQNIPPAATSGGS